MRMLRFSIQYESLKFYSVGYQLYCKRDEFPHSGSPNPDIETKFQSPIPITIGTKKYCSAGPGIWNLVLDTWVFN